MAGTHHLHKVGSARRRSVALGCVAIVGAAFVAAIGSMSSRADVPCAASVPDIASALSTAASCGRRVEIASLDAASSTTYADPDGTASTDLSTVPVRVPRAGGWVPVDLTLVRGSNGSIAPAAAPVEVTLGSAGATTIAKVSAGSGSLSYGWPTALPAPALNGPIATYSDVLPGVNLLVQVSTAGVELSFAFDSAAAARLADSITLPVTLDGLRAVTDSAHRLSYLDKNGTAVAFSAPPRAWDSRSGGTLLAPGGGPVAGVASSLASAAGPVLVPSGSTGSDVVTQASGLLTQALQIPRSLVDDPATRYPLVVDPGVTCTNCDEGHHGYVEYNGYDEIDSSWDGGHVHVGTFDGGGTRDRGLFQFAQGATHGESIVSATLKLTEVDSWNATAHSMTIYKSGSFNTSSTWPGPSVTTTNAVTKSFAFGHEVTGTIAIDVTGIAADFANDSGQTSYYFQFRAGSETDSSYWKEFAAAETLTVVYHSIPTVPGNQSVKPCFAQCAQTTLTSTQKPTLTAKASTSDGEDLDYVYEVGAGTAGAAGTKVTSTATSFTWPNTLTNGSTYEYRVKACDHGTTVCSAVSGWWKFKVDVTNPVVSTPTSTAFDLSNGPTPMGQEGVGGSVTIGATDANGIYGLAYSLVPGDITFSSPPTCPSTVGGDVFVVCGSPATVTIYPQDMVNTLTVVAFDKAGRSSSSSWKFTVNMTTADHPTHAWIDTDALGQQSPSATVVPDYSGVSGTKVNLTLSGNASWLGTDLGPHQQALSFTGDFAADGSAGAATTGATPLVIDSNHSFTAAVWVNPAVVNDGGYHTALAMDGGQVSQFYLQEHSGFWRFCMPVTATSNQCLSSATASATANTWTLLVAEWDAGQQTMTLYVGDSSTATSATHNAVASTAGAITVGRAVANANKTPYYWNLWNGAVADPLVYNVLLDTSQLNVLVFSLPAALQNG